jgi:hypothetical protein
MYRRIFLIFMAFVLATATFGWADDDHKPKSKPEPTLQSGKNTDQERHRADLQRLQENVKARGIQEVIPQMPTGKVTPPYPPSIVNPAVAINPLYPPGIGFNPAVDYTLPNFSQSPSIRKFIDSLPGLGAANQLWLRAVSIRILIIMSSALRSTRVSCTPICRRRSSVAIT